MTKMKNNPTSPLRGPQQRLSRHWRTASPLLAALFCLPSSAHASMFEGEALDKIADVITWVVLIVAPIVGIIVFLAIHILPEKIAEKKQHPQAKAIQCLCLLSLAFGGLLWPLAWLWTYTKPVLHKMAYGTDTVAHGHEATTSNPADYEEVEELRRLRGRVAELETKLAGKATAEGGKA